MSIRIKLPAFVNVKADPDEEIPFETQAVRLFRSLEFQILAGEYTPGQRLVRRELSQKCKVSQATVTEALWRLEADGLVESAPMYGTRVTPITLKRVQDELIMREALECQVARLAAGKITSESFLSLSAIAERVDLMMRDAESYSRDGMEAHQEFHLALARLTSSQLLLREVTRIWRRHCIFFMWVSARVLPPPPHWHRILLDAIHSGDAQVAETAMREHVLYGSSKQLKVLELMTAPMHRAASVAARQ